MVACIEVHALWELIVLFRAGSQWWSSSSHGSRVTSLVHLSGGENRGLGNYGSYAEPHAIRQVAEDMGVVMFAGRGEIFVDVGRLSV